MPRVLNVATPLEAATVVVPSSVPPPEAMETVTEELLVVTTLPNWSSTDTLMVPSDPAGWPSADSWVKAMWSAAAGVMVKLLEVAPVRMPSVALMVWAPALFSDRVLKVATPLEAAAVSVPLSVPLPLAKASVTVEPSEVTTLLYWSSTETTTLGMVTPATVLTGPVANTIFDAAAGLIVKLLEVSVDRRPSLTPRVKAPAWLIDKVL